MSSCVDLKDLSQVQFLVGVTAILKLFFYEIAFLGICRVGAINKKWRGNGMARGSTLD